MWLATGDQAGLVRAEREMAFFSSELPADYQEYFSELETAITAIDSPLRPVYTALGITASRTAIHNGYQSSLVIQHPDALNRTVSTTPDSLIPIRFEAYNSDQNFTNQEQLKSLRDRNLLVATKGWNTLHDAATHIVAYSLLDDEYLEIAAKRAKEDLNSKDEEIVRRRGRRLDIHLSTDKIAMPAAIALTSELYLAKGQRGLPNDHEFDSLPQNILDTWLGIAESLNFAVGLPFRGPAQLRRAKNFRGRCYALINAFSSTSPSPTISLKPPV